MTLNKPLIIYTLIAILIVNTIFLYPSLLLWEPILTIMALLTIGVMYLASCSQSNLEQPNIFKMLGIAIALVLVIISLITRFTENLPDDGLLWRWLNTIMYIILLLLTLLLNCKEKRIVKKEITSEEKKEEKTNISETKTTEEKSKTSKRLSDRDMIACNLDYELEYVLRKFAKRATKKNLEQIRTYCKDFKKKYGTHDRKKFYVYLKSNNRLKKLENVK